MNWADEFGLVISSRTSGVHYQYSFMVGIKKVWILISWLHRKPAYLDLHCFLTNLSQIRIHGVNEKPAGM